VRAVRGTLVHAVGSERMIKQWLFGLNFHIGLGLLLKPFTHLCAGPDSTPPGTLDFGVRIGTQRQGMWTKSYEGVAVIEASDVEQLLLAT